MAPGRGGLAVPRSNWLDLIQLRNFNILDFGHFYVFGIQVAQCLIILV